MELDKLLLGFLAFGAIVLICTLMITDLNTNYKDVGVKMNDSQFGGVVNKVNSIYNDSLSMNSRMLGTNASVSDLSTSESLYKGAYSTLTLIGNSYQIFIQITEDIAKTIGLGQQFAVLVQFAIAAFIISIIFAIIYLIFRI